MLRVRAISLLLLGALTCAAPACGNGAQSKDVHVDAGSVRETTLSALWNLVAQQGGFDPAGARVDRLVLDYSPTGSLLALSIVALTEDNRFVRINSQNSSLPEGSGINITGRVEPIGGQADCGVQSVAQLLQSLDQVGPQRLFSILGPPGEGGQFEIAQVPISATRPKAIPAGARALLWTGSSFEAAPAPLRDYEPNHSYLIAYRLTAAATPDASSESNSVTTMLDGDGAIFVVLPITR